MSAPRSICLLSLTSPATVTPGSGEDGHQIKPLSETENHGAHDRLVYTAVAQQIFVELEYRRRGAAGLMTWGKGCDLGSDQGKNALPQRVVKTLVCPMLPFPGIKLGRRVVREKGTGGASLGHCVALWP